MITPIWFELLGVGTAGLEDVATGGGELGLVELPVGRPVKQHR